MTKKQSFIKGTAILMVANAISKILGAIFKIPLTYLLKEEGMAIYNSAFNVYAFALSFVISGMPLAISKMIAEETALKREANAKKIVTVSGIFLGALGLLASVVLWLGADFFAIAMKEAKSVFAIKIIAPSVFFVALGVVFKSYYQGRMNMTPTAISQVIEAFIKLIAGYAFCYYFSYQKSEYSSAAAMMGVTIGEIIATFILFLGYVPDHFRISGKADKSSKKIIESISFIALPAIIASVISSFLNIADITLVRKSLEEIIFTPKSLDVFLRLYSPYTNTFDNLQSTMRLTSEGVRWLYGAYSGYALTVFHLPVGILSALGVSILPLIAGALAKNDISRAKFSVNSVLKITLLVVIPSAFCLLFFSENILYLLFKNRASAIFLSALAPTLIFISLSQIFNAVLNAKGKIIAPFLYGILGGIIKIILSVLLIRIPQINMLGVVISANISYFIVFILSYFSVKKNFGISFLKLFLKPFISGLFMAVIMWLLYNPFCVIFPNDTIAFLLTLLIGGVTYILMLISTKAITKEEILLIKKRVS